MLDNIPYKGANLSKITQQFGVNPMPYQPNGHTGLDMVGSYGTWLVAPQDVIITNIITSDTLDEDLAPLSRGYGIVMCTIEKPFVYYLYWHCLPVFPVEIGDNIRKGQQVAQMGNSGFIFYLGKPVPVEVRTKAPYRGTHVHYEKFTNEDGKRIYLDPAAGIDWSSKVDIDWLSEAIVVLKKMLRLLKRS